MSCIGSAHRTVCAHAKEISAATRISRQLEMAANELTTPAPLLRKIDEQERERTVLEQKIVASEKDDEAA